jgi:hypothetical protein
MKAGLKAPEIRARETHAKQKSGQKAPKSTSKKNKKTKKNKKDAAADPPDSPERRDADLDVTSTAKQRTTLTATVRLRRPLEPEDESRVKSARN